MLFVAACTCFVALVLEAADVSNASMLYLFAVLASAALFGSGPAMCAALASILAYNFFFVPPRYTLTVADNDEWIALGLLLISALITGQLAALMRERGKQARRREKEAVILYDVVRLMAEPGVRQAISAILKRLRQELGLAGALAVVGTDGSQPIIETAGDDQEAIILAQEAVSRPEIILGGGRGATGSNRAVPGRWIRVVRPSTRQFALPRRNTRVRTVPIEAEGARLGIIALVTKPDAPTFSGADTRLLSTVAHQLGRALERQRLQLEAAEAEALRRTDELRAALLNAVSHDLRTPLSSILAAAGSLLQADVHWSEEDRRAYAESIVREAERLDRLVGNLLDLSRIESGTIRPEKAWYDLGSLINEVVGRVIRRNADHPVAVDLPDQSAPLFFDYVEIEQVISNLLENALAHTPPGTQVRITALLGENAVQVDVSDNGPGVAPAALPHVFTPFYGSGVNGNGLGLSIARGLVEAHGGRIWVQNKPEGGARFAFTLPVGQRPAAVA
ncbi:MAG: DUF4118 domain-containing protein [Chloroflexi bacterium]|nr:MAG: DUF4118 domain-containing protein [Chloroflexota bacterium]